MNHIVIIGFMGSGKTRVGKRLAKDFNLPFVDVDRVVSKKMNLTMKEIFDSNGHEFQRCGCEELLLPEVQVLPDLLPLPYVLRNGPYQRIFHQAR